MYCICQGLGSVPFITAVLSKDSEWYYGSYVPRHSGIFCFENGISKNIAFFNKQEEALQQIYQLALVENL